MLERLLGESLAVSGQALRADRQGGSADFAGLPGRIAHVRDCLAAIGEDRSPQAAHGATARTRLLVALSMLPGGERRQHPRWPLAKAAMLRIGSHEADVMLLDLGYGGALLAPVAGLPAGRALDAALSLGNGPAVAATIATGSDRLVHLAFARDVAPHAEILAVEIEDWAAHYEAGLWQATALANEVEVLFAGAVDQGAIAPDDLFIAEPRRPDGRPDSLAARIEALLERALTPSDDTAYIAATDRNGFTISAPGAIVGPGGGHLAASPAMDAVTLRAARFSAKALVQTYRRRPGHEPLGVVADLSAPVFVRGRHWGCVRIGRALPKSARG